MKPVSLSEKDLIQVQTSLDKHNFKEAFNLIESGTYPQDNLHRYVYLSSKLESELTPEEYKKLLQNGFSYAERVPGKKEELYFYAKLNKLKDTDQFTLTWTQGIYHLIREKNSR